MYFSSWEELQKLAPVQDGVWDKDRLAEYLVQSCNISYEKQIDAFFSQYEDDAALADLLFDILLDDDYDGSDSQMGAAHYISKLNRETLKEKKGRLAEAQANEVDWKRPFHDEDSFS